MSVCTSMSRPRMSVATMTRMSARGGPEVGLAAEMTELIGFSLCLRGTGLENHVQHQQYAHQNGNRANTKKWVELFFRNEVSVEQKQAGDYRHCGGLMHDELYAG